uniref:ATP synthase complex subunit 8 n=1 Tax=Mareca penelope TaxID=8838 RepID=A0A7L7T9J2_MARPN|nr:ATP synthase F0 subunit 8 [Mareca penelope]QOC71409.1 ATP synthase F0 subunit 8 [Mareca penelope]
MPQLNPAPWFSIMVMTWLTLALLIQPKLLTFTHNKPPIKKTITTTKPTPWAWPWT